MPSNTARGTFTSARQPGSARPHFAPQRLCNRCPSESWQYCEPLSDLSLSLLREGPRLRDTRQSPRTGPGPPCAKEASSCAAFSLCRSREHSAIRPLSFGASSVCAPLKPTPPVRRKEIRKPVHLQPPGPCSIQRKPVCRGCRALVRGFATSLLPEAG